MTKAQENSAVKSAISMQDDILEGSRDINNVLSTSNQVSPLFHTHYVNMETGKNGIQNLIIQILTEREAIFNKSILTGNLKNIAIASSMYAEEIIAEVQAKFASGSKRYPYTTTHQYLSIFMFRKGIVGKINSETCPGYTDPNRHCCKPRTKWYLIKP